MNLAALCAVTGLLLLPVLRAGVDTAPPNRAVPETELRLRGQLAMLQQLNMGLNTLYYDLKSPERYAQVARTVRDILPLVAELRQLSSAELRQLCLLGDAIVWQGRWAVRVGREDMLLSAGACSDEDDTVGYFEDWVRLADEIEVLFAASDDKKAPLAAELCLMLVAMGGEQVLKLPGQLLDERLCRDYKTACVFFRDFAMAIESGNVAALSEQLPVLDYLLQGGLPDRLRVGRMAANYAPFAAMRLMTGEEDFAPSSELQQALQPFFSRLPELRQFLP